jgi:hypothetical protein
VIRIGHWDKDKRPFPPAGVKGQPCTQSTEQPSLRNADRDASDPLGCCATASYLDRAGTDHGSGRGLRRACTALLPCVRSGHIRIFRLLGGHRTARGNDCARRAEAQTHAGGDAARRWIDARCRRADSARSAAPPAAARLLPSGDAYFLHWRADRSLLVPEARRRSALWTSRLWPGVLSGEVSGRQVKQTGDGRSACVDTASTQRPAIRVMRQSLDQRRRPSCACTQVRR